MFSGCASVCACVRAYVLPGGQITNPFHGIILYDGRTKSRTRSATVFSEEIAYVFLSSSIAFEIRAVRFYSRGAMLARLLAMALCPCLCLSVCLSVCHKSVFYQKGWTD